MNREQLLKEIGFTDEFISDIRDFETKVPEEVIYNTYSVSENDTVIKIQQFEVDYTKPVIIYQPS